MYLKKIDIAFKNVKVILFYIINNFYITGVKCNSLIPSFKFKFQFNFLVCPTPFKFKLMQKYNKPMKPVAEKNMWKAYYLKFKRQTQTWFLGPW